MAGPAQVRLPRRRLLRPGSLQHASRGQSLVEFALVLPMLLVLFFGLADFGRVFAAGITMEAAARNAAEAAAQEYVQLARNKPGGVLDPNDYARLHTMALDRVCQEAEVLPNEWTPFGSSCKKALAAVCVHDGADPACGAEADPSVVDCDDLNGAWDPANGGAAPLGSTPLAYVEVRVCYQFKPLLFSLELPFAWGISLGTIHLEKGREFTVANY